MPQLDKLIFFFENMGFVMSFFSLVFYNQYYFYPKLLKNLYVRRYLVNQNSITMLFQLFMKIQKNFLISLNFSKIKELQYLFNQATKHLFLRFSYWLNLKLTLIDYFFNLFLNKFSWSFFFFYEIYRTYIIEYDFK
jgi:hypothetical protein